MKTYLIIYHKEDNDGIVSAALFYDYLTTKLNIDETDIQLLGTNYNEMEVFAKSYQPKDLHETYDHIVLTDISFNGKYMKSLFDEYQSDFIWCDHHAPIINESILLEFSRTNGIRNTTKSAILCAYEYLYDQFNERYNKKDIPEIFRILSAWDSCSYEREGYDFEYVKAINKAYTIKFNLQPDLIIQNVHNIIKHWEEEHVNIFDNDEYFDYGNILNNYDDIVNENIINTFGDCSWKVKFEDKGIPLYHKACAIFHEGASNSTMFKCLKDKGINHGLVFKHQSNGNWVMSMYNINEDECTDCGEFLKERYNGGGHKFAAGCTFTEKQFIKLLRSKIL